MLCKYDRICDGPTSHPWLDLLGRIPAIPGGSTWRMGGGGGGVAVFEGELRGYNSSKVGVERENESEGKNEGMTNGELSRD